MNRFGCRWTIPETAVRSFGVVEVFPLFNQDLCFEQGMEDLTVEELVPHSAIERFYESILPWTTRCDERGCDVQFVQPMDKMLSDELRTIVTANMFWSAILGEEIC